MTLLYHNGGSGLVVGTENVEACDGTDVFGGPMLGDVEVGGDGDSVVHPGLAEPLRSSHPGA